MTRDGHVVPTPEEETVFQVLGMQPVPLSLCAGRDLCCSVSRTYSACSQYTGAFTVLLHIGV